MLRLKDDGRHADHHTTRPRMRAAPWSGRYGCNRRAHLAGEDQRIRRLKLRIRKTQETRPNKQCKVSHIDAMAFGTLPVHPRTHDNWYEQCANARGAWKEQQTPTYSTNLIDNFASVGTSKCARPLLPPFVHLVNFLAALFRCKSILRGSPIALRVHTAVCHVYRRSPQKEQAFNIRAAVQHKSSRSTFDSLMIIA